MSQRVNFNFTHSESVTLYTKGVYLSLKQTDIDFTEGEKPVNRRAHSDHVFSEKAKARRRLQLWNWNLTYHVIMLKWSKEINRNIWQKILDQLNNNYLQEDLLIFLKKNVSCCFCDHYCGLNIKNYNFHLHYFGVKKLWMYLKEAWRMFP